ncbi:hypothetical protein NUW58_g5298 [Xylaria curta]|uniref:Uncharacterized protein n=1 Tax=Xylaria curta TaxID=42375 RepID=A0ACC1P4P5_9PEZI|nr:hypothetical protein NUW58_g5298 [Xylaria curta]
MEEDSPVARAFHKFTYPRLRLNDHTLDDNLPVFQPQRDNDRSHALPTASIGVLDILPPELLAEILCQLDLRTLLDFRYVNRRAADLVNYLPQYKGITTHARNALRGILSIETGRWITCAALYEKLCTPVCEQCGDFGGYLYLLTCKRVCFLCLSRNPIYLPLPPGRASRKFGLQRQIVERLPRMKAIPGTYSPNEKKVAKCTLVDYESALHAGVALHGSLDAMLKRVSDAEVMRNSRTTGGLLPSPAFCASLPSGLVSLASPYACYTYGPGLGVEPS